MHMCFFIAYKWVLSKLISSFLFYLVKQVRTTRGRHLLHLDRNSLPEDRWWFPWEGSCWELRYSRWWSGTRTSCVASWTLCGSSLGPPHSGTPWSWSPPSPWHLYSAWTQPPAQWCGHGYGSVSTETTLPYLHGFAESVGEVELSVLEALHCGGTRWRRRWDVGTAESSWVALVTQTG